MISYNQVKWTVSRICFLTMFSLALLTGVGIYLFAPLTSYYFFNDLRFWKYLRHYHRMMVFMYRFFYTMLTSNEWRFHSVLSMNDPPLSGPDRTYVNISNEWQEAENSCGDCCRCCIQISCPLLDLEMKKCMGYDSFYWRYFNCGRFPVNQAHIDYYNCIKWEMIPLN